MTDSDTRLPQDPLGKALMGYDFDFEMCKVAMYKSDGAGGVEIWDGIVDIDVTGSFYLNLDEVETLLTGIDAVLDNIYAFQQDAHDAYKLSDFDTGSDPMYTGEVDKDGNWIITEYNIANGTVRYASGSSGYTTSWTGRAGLSYDYYYTEF